MPSRRTNQCSFFETEDGRRRRCRRNGTGNPPLCQRHTAELDERDESPFAEVLGSILSGKRPSQRAVEDAAGAVMEGLFGRRMSPEEIGDFVRRARAGSSFPGSPPRSHSGPGPDASSSPRETAEQAKARAISKARRTLGFAATEPLTKDQVKKRWRTLCMKHHPDKGGDAAKMAEINAAYELLVG